MKKLLLSLLVLFGVQWASADEFVYGICSDEINGVGTGMGGSNYSAAIEVPEPVAAALQGSKVTSVSVGFKSGLIKIINVYLTYDLEGEPFYTQEGRVKVNTFNDVVLDTPYTIEGRKFYIGYTYRQSSSTGSPIGFDNRNLGGMPAFSHLALWPDGGDPEWLVRPDYGALSIRATVEGDKKLENCVIPVGLSLPKAVSLGKEFTCTLDVLNYGSSPVSQISTVTTVGANAPVDNVFSFDTPLAPGERRSVQITAVTAIENNETNVSVDVVKVGDADNLWASLGCSGMVVASDFVYPRMIVIEEGTGTGCGYCVAGYVALEQMREKHPDDYVGIAVHNYSGDPMRCASYEPWVNRYISGYPNATMNRAPSIGTFNPQPNTCEAHYNELAGVLNMMFRIEAEFDDETKTKVKTRTYFGPGYDMDESQYAIALVETEDNLGPYQQRNNYSGGALGPMYGFEDLGGWVSLTYNDVARAIYNWQGKQGSLPTTMKKRVTYTYDETLPILTSASKIEDANFIALLIDRSTSEIITAAKCKPGEPGTIGAGVNSIVPAPEARVRAIAGGIAVEGSFDRAEIYGFDGMLHSCMTSSGETRLPAGIYIVRVCDGSKTSTSKILVK